jgi:hypothetical protein
VAPRAFAWQQMAPARSLEAVEVDERFNGEIVWQGKVKVFALDGHPSALTGDAAMTG